jgi:predicted nucleic acid-binding protein
VRILCSSGYPGANLIPDDIIESLAHFCASHQHEFWSDSVSLLDGSIFKPRMLAGGRAITDAYLLALAVRNGGRLATFDRTIPVKAVTGAGPQHVALIGAGGR